jgi:hypothetical protein
MSNVCDQCGKSNRANAMFCIGCTAKLRGFVPSGPSVLESMNASPVRNAKAPPTADAAWGSRSGRWPSGMKLFCWLLGTLAFAITVSFAAWLVHSAGRPSEPDRPTDVQVQEPLQPTPPAGEAVPAFPAPEVAVPRPGNAVSPTNPPTGGAHVRVVEEFYRALSAADGEKAAALVIPEKRGRGPFNAAGMSRFYGSFERPLLVRSIRPLDARRVEVKYSYRVASTRCEGTAVVETQRTGNETLIRRILANC